MIELEYLKDATPISPEEVRDLIPKHITTQEQLNTWEQQNILIAEKWLKKSKGDILSISFIKELHKHMFDQTWKWAGKFRMSEKNIGIQWQFIPIEIRKACDDSKYQIEHAIFSFDEIAVRLHHRIVFIHPFPNGNGRHGRLLADTLVMSLGKPRFTWGMNNNLQKVSSMRTQYINALRMADKGDISLLLSFARS